MLVVVHGIIIESKQMKGKQSKTQTFTYESFGIRRATRESMHKQI